MSARQRLLAACAGLAAWFGGIGAGTAAPPVVSSTLPIDLEAQSSDFDYRNNLLVFRHVKIRQGELSVESDEATATGLSFDDSRWDFRGSVRITMPDGSLLSDAATIQFVKNVISSALITGSPATFEQRRDECVARGRAGRIEYDFGAQTVRLSEQAWLSYGNGEINGRTLVYSMRDQRVLANPQDQADQRVKITINPQAGPASPGAPKCGR